MTDFEKIEDYQKNIRSVLDSMTDKTDDLRKENEDRIEAYYQQIIGFIKDAFIPYAEIFKTWKITCYRQTKDIDGIMYQDVGYLVHNRNGWYIHLYVNNMADNSTSAEDFVFIDSHGWKQKKEDIVLAWTELKSSILEAFERMSDELNSELERQSREQEKLSAMLDEFKL